MQRMKIGNAGWKSFGKSTGFSLRRTKEKEIEKCLNCKQECKLN